MIGVPGLYAALRNAIRTRAKRAGGFSAWAFPRLLSLSRWVRRRLGLRLGRLLFARVHAEFGGQLRVLASGGAKLDPEVAWDLEGLGWQVLSGYGLTETAPMLTFNPPGRARPDSEGLPVAGVELRIEPVEGEAYGEVLARGPNVFSGYLDDPEATQAAFAGPGWFRTRDLGFLDGDGYLHVVGRADETIVLPGGKKLFPEEIEGLYAEMPFVKETGILLHEGALVALIVPDTEAIRLRGGSRAESLMREEIEHLLLRLKPHQRIAGYAISAEPLPRTNLGKLKRHRLPALYARAKAGTVEAPEAAPAVDASLLQTPAARAVWEWLTARYPDRRLGPDTSLQFDLGIDSLQSIELSMELEDRFGIRLSEAALSEALSVSDLLEAVARQPAGEEAPSERAALTPEQLRWLEPPGLGYVLLGLLLHAINRAAARLLFQLEVEGKHHVPPTGSVVLAPNHASYLDPPSAGASCAAPIGPGGPGSCCRAGSCGA
jgi:long-chain acyl-CoA synthetase